MNEQTIHLTDDFIEDVISGLEMIAKYEPKEFLELAKSMNEFIRLRTVVLPLKDDCTE
jgi:hypothetical protein